MGYVHKLYVNSVLTMHFMAKPKNTIIIYKYIQYILILFSAFNRMNNIIGM